MSDRELLELAAKAAGIEISTWSNAQAGGFQTHESAGGRFWNPLTDDGDALRLAVKLGFDINAYPKSNEVAACKHGEIGLTRHFEYTHRDPYAAIRRAIVRAAAEIGRTQ